MDFCSVYIMAGDEQEANKIARALVDEKLAACVNYFPVRSVFRWDGKVEETPEVSLIAKTRAELFPQLMARVKEMHSYTVPCIVEWAIENGNPEYLNWIKDSTE